MRTDIPRTGSPDIVPRTILSRAPPAHSARVLSYNFNLLPNCFSFSNAHYAEERISEFTSRVGSRFDILALQEVFSSSLIPVAAREYWCNQHQLIHALSEPQPIDSRERDPNNNNSNSNNNIFSPLESTTSSQVDGSSGHASEDDGATTPIGVSPKKECPPRSNAEESTPCAAGSAFAPPQYPYVVKARQPSFLRMTRHTIITDSGLVIFSKFPIVDSGSMYFRSAHHWSRQLAPKGCLFAKIRLSESLFVIVINVHLSSSSTAQETSIDGQVSQTVSDQLLEMRHFIETIQSEHPKCPMIITGDFNINSIAQQNNLKTTVGRATPTPVINGNDPVHRAEDLTPIVSSGAASAVSASTTVGETEAYRQLVATMSGISLDMCEVLKDSMQQHPPTRPATLQFPSFLNKMVATRFPQRHDYCFFTNGNADESNMYTVGHPRLQRFLASSQRPYMYLSDHFGISLTLRHKSISLSTALRLEGYQVPSQPSRSWLYPLMKHARSISRKDFSDGWDRYFESAFFDSAFKVIGYLFFPMFVYFLLSVFPALWYVVAAIVAGLAANHVFGNKVLPELQEMEFGLVDKDVIAGKRPVSATNKSVGATKEMVDHPPKSVWEMWTRSVNEYGWQPCLGYRTSEMDVKWITYLEADKQIRAFGSALKGLRAKQGTVVGVLVDCHHLNPIIDLACQAYGFVCLPLVPDVKISRQLMDTYSCKISIASRKYTPRLLLARSRKLTCVVQLEEIGSYEYDLARGASIELRGYDQLVRERQSYGPLDRPMCEEQAAAEAAATFAMAAAHTGNSMATQGSARRDRSPSPSTASSASFSAGVACYTIGDEEEVNRTAIPLSRQQLVNSIISSMETNLVQDRRAIPNLTERKDPSSAQVFAIVAPFSNGFNRMLAFAVLASGHQLAMCEQASGNSAAADLRALQPDVLVCTRAYLMYLNSRLGMIESRYCWLRQMFFRWAFRFRSRLLRHSKRDSSSLRYLFFGDTFSQKVMRCRDVNVKRLIVESPSISIPYRIREMSMLCITPIVRECVVDAFGQLVAVDGMPPPRTMITFECLSRGMDEDEVAGGVALKRLGAGPCPQQPGDEPNLSPIQGDQWCDTKLAALWKDDKKLHFLGAKADLLWPLGNVRAVATELEALYKRSCPMIHHIFITCDEEKPLLAIIVPHRDVIEDMLEERISNWSVFTQAATPLLMESLRRIAISNGLPTAHFIEFIHIHPHAFSLHDDFVSASGGLRRKKLREYFRLSISRLYSGRVANGGGGLTSAAGNEDELPATPVEGIPTSHSFAAVGQQAAYTARRRGYSGPQATTPFAVDIGGTCAKFAFFQPPDAPPLPKFCQLAKVEASFALPKNIKFFRNQTAAKKDANAGELRFVQCSTQDVPAMVEYIANNKLCDKYKEDGLRYIPATGGGAFRFAPLVESQLGIQLTQLKEMDCIIAGINFLLRHAPELTFTFDLATSRRIPCVDPTIRPTGKDQSDTESPISPVATRAPFDSSTTSLPSTPIMTGVSSPEERANQKDAFTSSFFPYLLVNIGSGVSMIKCNSEVEGDFVRVGGSLIGGGTFWGLVRSMTNLTSWDEINEMTRVDGPGDNTNVDLLVGDIYGYNATALPGNLHVDIIASTFGKIGADRGDKYFQDGMVGGATAITKQEEESYIGDEMDPPSGHLSVSVHHSRNPSSLPEGLGGEHVLARSASNYDLGGSGILQNPISSVTSSPNSASGRASRRETHKSNPARPQPIDIVRSLVIMMAFNVSQLANLTCQIEGIKTVFFTGGFVRNNPIVHNQLTKALGYWSGGKLKARFIEPDGFVGTLGSLQHVPPTDTPEE